MFGNIDAVIRNGKASLNSGLCSDRFGFTIAILSKARFMVNEREKRLFEEYRNYVKVEDS